MNDPSGQDMQGSAQPALLAGRRPLDFANTISGDGTANPVEHLTSSMAVLGWMIHAGLAPASMSGAPPAGLEPGPFLALRAAINRIGTALTRSLPPDPVDLAALREAVRDGLDALALVKIEDGGLVWGANDATEPAGWRARLALEMIDVLRYDDLKRLRRCPAQDCGWLFLDTSKAGKRRWCDMAVCGNRAKLRRHRTRLVCDGPA